MVDTLHRDALFGMLLKGQLDLGQPLLLVWGGDEDEYADGSCSNRSGKIVDANSTEEGVHHASESGSKGSTATAPTEEQQLCAIPVTDSGSQHACPAPPVEALG